MKHFILRLTLIAMLLPSFNAFAYYNFKANGIYYYFVSQSEKTIGVGYDATSSNKYSEHITIPATVTYNNEIYTVTEIGNSAFYNCQRLSSVSIPNTITEIEDNAFSSCSGLTSISIPNSVTKIGANSFSSCSNLRQITMGNGIISIGKSAFENCNNLNSINIPDGISSIEARTFKGCSKLSFISIPNSIISIEEQAFEDCYELDSLRISNSVSSIGDYAFGDCCNIISITCECKTPPTISENTFSQTLSSTTLYVPMDSKDYYINAIGWKNFTNILEFEIEATGINEVSSNNIRVYGSNNSIIISGTENNLIKVFDINGTLINSLSSTNSTVEIKVPSNGLYIVKIDNKSYKVLF